GLGVWAVSPAGASRTYSFTSGNHAASAAFAIDGSHLVITLTNTSTEDTRVPSDVLTAFFFGSTADLSGLSRVSALLAPGSTVILDPDGPPAGGVVGGEWAYKLHGSQLRPAHGISSSGLDLFGPGDRFPGADLAWPPSLAGVNYGIVSAGDDPATGNGGIMNTGGLIKNAVVFRLGGLPTDFGLHQLGDTVVFQYGSGLNEPSFSGHNHNSGPQIPELAVWQFSAFVALGGLALLRRRRA
ncbi:MAG TPA: XDD4 family exosortase-dependent surface protein, partial [Chthonomonadales bacterium]|nr:XDD4 family exosortase-dependent surface protein [Chthonomonadales bacterium]